VSKIDKQKQQINPLVTFKGLLRGFFNVQNQKTFQLEEGKGTEYHTNKKMSIFCKVPTCKSNQVYNNKCRLHNIIDGKKNKTQNKKQIKTKGLSMNDIFIYRREVLAERKKVNLLENHKTNKEEDCSICIDEIESETIIKFIKCKHIFHIDCLSKWIVKGNNKCPLCRSTIL